MTLDIGSLTPEERVKLLRQLTANMAVSAQDKARREIRVEQNETSSTIKNAYAWATEIHQTRLEETRESLARLIGQWMKTATLVRAEISIEIKSVRGQPKIQFKSVLQPSGFTGEGEDVFGVDRTGDFLVSPIFGAVRRWHLPNGEVVNADSRGSYRVLSYFGLKHRDSFIGTLMAAVKTHSHVRQLKIESDQGTAWLGFAADQLASEQRTRR